MTHCKAEERDQNGLVKVPSHVDLEGNKRVDELADEGVKKHDARLVVKGKNKKPTLKRPEPQKSPPGKPAGTPGKKKKSG